MKKNKKVEHQTEVEIILLSSAFLSSNLVVW